MKRKSFTKSSVDKFWDIKQLSICIRLIRSELRFLQSDNMKWLESEADMGACHDEYPPLRRRIKRLKKILKNLK